MRRRRWGEEERGDTFFSSSSSVTSFSSLGQYQRGGSSSVRGFSPLSSRKRNPSSFSPENGGSANLNNASPPSPPPSSFSRADPEFLVKSCMRREGGPSSDDAPRVGWCEQKRGKRDRNQLLSLSFPNPSTFLARFHPISGVRAAAVANEVISICVAIVR